MYCVLVLIRSKLKVKHSQCLASLTSTDIKYYMGYLREVIKGEVYGGPNFIDTSQLHNGVDSKLENDLNARSCRDTVTRQAKHRLTVILFLKTIINCIESFPECFHNFPNL